MDPFLMGIGPYNFGTDSLAMNNMMMYPILNNYQNQIACLEGYNDMMSMNGSLFPAFTGATIDYDQFYSTMRENQDRIIDNNLHQTQKWRENDLKMNAPIDRVKHSAELLHEKIEQNEQEQFKNALDEYVHSVQAAFDPNGVADKEDVMAKAETLYKQFTGKSLREDIRSYGDGSFEHGFWQTLSLGMYDGITAEENISGFTGQPVGRKERRKKIAGNVAGGASWGLALGTVLGRFKSGKLALLGTIVGGIAGYFGANGASKVKA